MKGHSAMLSNQQIWEIALQQSAWSNIASARNAVKSGLVPAWAEMTVKPAEYVEELNR